MAVSEDRYTYQKLYASTPEGKAAFNKARLKWRVRNKVKNTAAQRVRNAVKSGQMVKPGQCEGCKTRTKLHGHHDNYYYPLKVKWLCDICHRSWHRVFGKAINKRIRGVK